MDKVSGIYMITQEDTGRIYVGSSININYRKSQHFQSLRKGIHYNHQMQIDADEFGIESFRFEVIELTSDDDIILSQREMFWQDSLNTQFGYNPIQLPRRNSSIKPKTLKVIRTIYANFSLWQHAQRQAGNISLSMIISRLLEMWLAGEVKVTIEPRG